MTVKCNHPKFFPNHWTFQLKDLPLLVPEKTQNFSYNVYNYPFPLSQGKLGTMAENCVQGNP